jgi:hypothetical protein
MRLWLSPRSPPQPRRPSPRRLQSDRRNRPLPTAGRAFRKCQQTVVSPRLSELQRTRKPARRCVPAWILKLASRSARQNRQLPERNSGNAKAYAANYQTDSLLPDVRGLAGCHLTRQSLIQQLNAYSDGSRKNDVTAECATSRSSSRRRSDRNWRYLQGTLLLFHRSGRYAAHGYEGPLSEASKPSSADPKRVRLGSRSVSLCRLSEFHCGRLPQAPAALSWGLLEATAIPCAKRSKGRVAEQVSYVG